MGVQLVISFFIWIGYAFWMSKSSCVITQKRSSETSKHPILKGIMLLFAASVVLMLGLYILAYFHVANEGKMSLLGWILCTLLGIFFVQMQVSGAAMMMNVFKRQR